MLAFAIDNPTPCTIVIITGDRDLAYALAILKLRSYRIVLVTLPNAHTSLTAQSSVAFDWSNSILKPPIISTTSPSAKSHSKHPAPHASSSQKPQSPPEYVCRLPNPSSTDILEANGSTDITHYLRKQTTPGISSSQATSSRHNAKDINPV